MQINPKIIQLLSNFNRFSQIFTPELSSYLLSSKPFLASEI